nr:MAG TPA: hypothetical protein [Caudoviricetes sp.]
MKKPLQTGWLKFFKFYSVHLRVCAVFMPRV